VFDCIKYLTIDLLSGKAQNYMNVLLEYIIHVTFYKTHQSPQGVGSCSELGELFKLSGHICME